MNNATAMRVLTGVVTFFAILAGCVFVHLVALIMERIIGHNWYGITVCVAVNVAWIVGGMAIFGSEGKTK